MSIPSLQFILHPQERPSTYSIVRYNIAAEKGRARRAREAEMVTNSVFSTSAKVLACDNTIQPSNTAPNPKRIDRDNPFDGKPEPTILIIGAGTFGTSTAYHLAHIYKDPSKVTVIDQAPSPPKPAASIDVNRVIRTDYANKLYCDLACETIHPWFWSEELGPYFHKVGWLMLEEEGSNLKARIKETFLGRGSTQAEDIALNKICEKFSSLKGTSTEGFQSSYFNPEAGWCDAAAATHSFMKAAERKGVRRITGTVTELIYDSSSNRISGAKTSDGRILHAEKVLLSAGPWTSQILSSTEDSLNFTEDQSIESQIQATGLIAAYYNCSPSEISSLTTYGNTTQRTDNSCPVVVYGGLGEIVPPGKSNNLMKYANSKSGIINSIPTKSGARKISIPADQYTVPEILKKETEDMIAKRVAPQITKGKRPDYWRICWDAQSPTEDFLICAHPDKRLGGLYLATGGSFHSYKFLPIIGKYILNTLNSISNGEEKDKAWGWKGKDEKWVDVHERGLLSVKAVTKTELSELFRRGGEVSVSGPRL
ncbi:L-pipecolate oxidase [Pseudocercospora fuligena]|uniref:L-pipecolate oxidase n=1 Tax=Pseudocercospora fuligena TaxID=685502 RepID=A0A8H6RCA9_9PEZI|nr:L-pipecolate oxidase [Pseudocercospora fuligena]